jgi:hypothetical protein
MVNVNFKKRAGFAYLSVSAQPNQPEVFAFRTFHPARER